MAALSPPDDIWSATRRGDLEAVRQFVERDGIPDVEDDHDAQSLLSVACGAGHVDVVRFLQQQGARSTRYVGRAPEAFAAMENDQLEVFRLLCEHSLDPYATRYSKNGEYLIHQAMSERRAAFVRLLRDRGGIVALYEYDDGATLEELQGDSPPSEIELAARAGDSEYVAFLLEVGVDLEGQTPNYYLLKANRNVTNVERRLRDEYETKLRSRLRSRPSHQEEENSLFCGCMVFGVSALALGWICYRVALWMGWFEFSLVALLVLIVFGRMKGNEERG